MSKKAEPKTKPFYVIEDVTGRLSLMVFSEDHSRLIYVNRSYGDNPGMLKEALKQLRQGIDPETSWDGDELTRSTAPDPEHMANWFPEEEQEYSHDGTGIRWRIIADEQGVYPGRMLEKGRQEMKGLSWGETNPCYPCWHSSPIHVEEIHGAICEGLLSPEGCCLARREEE